MNRQKVLEWNLLMQNALDTLIRTHEAYRATLFTDLEQLREAGVSLCCPNCQSVEIESTCIGVIVGEHDPNRHTCKDCNYAWKQVK